MHGIWTSCRYGKGAVLESAPSEIDLAGRDGWADWRLVDLNFFMHAHQRATMAQWRGMDAGFLGELPGWVVVH